MKRLFFALMLAFAGNAFAQQTTLYQCPTMNLEGRTAHLGSECPAWVWTAPNRDILVATCGNATCGWNSNTTWRRVSNLPANAAVSACTGTVSGRNCTREAWVRRDSVFPDTPPPAPVDCEVTYPETWTPGAWGACSISTGQRSRIESRTGVITRQPANGGTACPTNLTQTRTVFGPCDEPLPRVSYTFGVDRNPIVTGETATITWTSENAVACTLANVTDGSLEDAGLSGSRVIGPYTAQSRAITLTCGNFFGEFYGTLNLVVSVPPSRSPACWPHLADARKVRAAPLVTPDPKWELKATWFCPSTSGPPRQMAWVTTYAEVAKRIELELRGEAYDEAEAAAQCESTCITLPEGAVKNELDAFAAQYTSEIGVVGSN